MKELTHLSLFSGIGGLDLAAEWAGFTTVGQCEYADYPTKVLEKHWPDVPRWRDIRTLTKESFYERTGRRTVDVISGGFPCQPFSVAGKQRGKEDDRYLWPEMVRVIKELRPTWIVGENVAGIVRMALPDILSELEAEGYRTRTFLIPACAVGARHRRYRVAIVGYADNNGLYESEVGRIHEKDCVRQQERKGASVEPTGAGGPAGNKTLADSQSDSEGRLPFGKEAALTGFRGGSENVADSEGERERGLSIQPRKAQKENANTERCGQDVQHTNSAGCEEQYASGKPDSEGFPCRGCDERDVCNSAGERLSHWSGKPMEGCGASEQEPQRPDRNVPDTDRCATLRRKPCKGAFGEFAGSREHIRNGKEEYEKWQRRTAQPGLSGVAHGLPGWVDGYWDTEPDIPRIAQGVKNRIDRLKGLGNAVVPPQFYPVLHAIAEIELMADETKRESK